MWIANKAFRYRGASYQRGDVVPAETWANRRAFQAKRCIRRVDDVPVEPETAPEPIPEATVAPNLSEMKRADLNAYATEHGVADAESYPNKDALIEAIEAAMTAPDDDDVSDGDGA